MKESRKISMALKGWRMNLYTMASVINSMMLKEDLVASVGAMTIVVWKVTVPAKEHVCHKTLERKA